MPSKRTNQTDPFDLDEQATIFDWGERLRRLYFDSKRLLASWWWILLLSLSVGIAWQAYQELNRDPVYVSHAEMMVSGRFALPDNVYREELSNFFGTQMTLMRSARVQQRAHERVAMLQPGIERGWVRIAVEQRPQASIFRLRAEGAKPEYTRAFLDAVMEEYQNFRREMRSETSESTLLAVTEQLYRLEDEIDAQEEAVVEFQRENNLVFLKEQDTSAGIYLARLTNQQAEFQTQLLILQNIGIDDAVELGDLTGRNSGVSSLVGAENIESFNYQRSLLGKLKAEKDEFSLYLKPRHPKIIDLNMEIERSENLIRILERQTFASLDERKNLLRRQIRNLDAVIEQWEQTALEISRKSAEFERLNYRVSRSRETYQRLLDSVQAIKSNQQLEQETVGVLEFASSPSTISLAVGRKVTEGAITGLLAGIGLIIGIAFLDTKVRTSEDLQKRFDIPMLGILPEENKNDIGLIDLLQLKDGRHRFSEACRALRSTIYLHRAEAKGKKPQTFIITSAIPGEGKSTVAANLAVTFSFTGERVLLVDADMRRGHLRALFSFDKDPGLSDILSGEASFESVIRPTTYECLDFVGGGISSEIPGERLLSGKMDEFIDWAKQHYDLILFDSPPVLAVDDTMSLAGKTDAILFVVRAHLTSGKEVQASFDRLSKRTSKVLGFIFNCAEAGGADYYHYRHYDRYYDDSVS